MDPNSITFGPGFSMTTAALRPAGAPSPLDWTRSSGAPAFGGAQSSFGAPAFGASTAFGAQSAFAPDRPSSSSSSPGQKLTFKVRTPPLPVPAEYSLKSSTSSGGKVSPSGFPTTWSTEQSSSSRNQLSFIDQPRPDTFNFKPSSPQYIPSFPATLATPSSQSASGFPTTWQTPSSQSDWQQPSQIKSWVHWLQEISKNKLDETVTFEMSFQQRYRRSASDRREDQHHATITNFNVGDLFTKNTGYLYLILKIDRNSGDIFYCSCRTYGFKPGEIPSISSTRISGMYEFYDEMVTTGDFKLIDDDPQLQNKIIEHNSWSICNSIFKVHVPNDGCAPKPDSPYGKSPYNFGKRRCSKKTKTKTKKNKK